MSEVKDILIQGYFDGGEYLDAACKMESLSKNLTDKDALVVSDSAAKIRVLTKLVQGLSKKGESAPDVFYKIQDVERLTRISKGIIYKMAGNGDFPRPLKIGQRSSGWVKEDVDKWVSELIRKHRENS